MRYFAKSTQSQVIFKISPFLIPVLSTIIKIGFKYACSPLCLIILINGKIDTIAKWLNENKITDINAVLNEVKEAIFNDLKTSQIEKIYYRFLKNLVAMLN